MQGPTKINLKGKTKNCTTLTKLTKITQKYVFNSKNYYSKI